jgi:hypothetical protein
MLVPYLGTYFFFVRKAFYCRIVCRTIQFALLHEKKSKNVDRYGGRLLEFGENISGLAVIFSSCIFPVWT